MSCQMTKNKAEESPHTERTGTGINNSVYRQKQLNADRTNNQCQQSLLHIEQPN